MVWLEAVMKMEIDIMRKPSEIANYFESVFSLDAGEISPALIKRAYDNGP